MKRALVVQATGSVLMTVSLPSGPLEIEITDIKNGNYEGAITAVITVRQSLTEAQAVELREWWEREMSA